jgi:phosphoribosylformylglycinamidine cyclo-ligase
VTRVVDVPVAESEHDPEHDPERPPVSYATAGVDIDAAERSVALMASRVAATHGPEVLEGIGGFGGLFRPDTSGWRDPVLVSSADGVGTKVELARRLGRLGTVGQDLVAMVVDDLVAVGARPLFMNDYLAVGRLDPERVAELVGGVADGCRIAGCALVGGETAEHPGLLEPDAFDLAGFAVGVVERDALLGPARVREADVLVALPSSGLHANGYSLVRRIIEGLDLAAHHGLDRPLGDELMEPTRIHTPDVLAVADALGADLHAACHVTGGGLPGNLPRVLPDGLDADVEVRSWELPPIFRWLAERGPVETDELRRTFNCGVGMVLVVAPDAVDAAKALLEDRGVAPWILGRVRVEEPGVERVRYLG